MRGNISKFASFSTLFKPFSNLSITHQTNGHPCSNLLKIRVFSSLDNHTSNTQAIANDNNDFDDDINKDLRRDGRNFNAQQSFRDDSFKLNENGYQPSIRELFNSPLKGVEKEESRDNKVSMTGSSEEGEKMEMCENAEEIFSKMKESGFIPNAVAMIDELCKDGLIHEAMKLFGLMREKGSMPEVVVYTSVVEGFCQARKFDDAKRIFKKMKDKGVIPNAFSYSVLIKGFCMGKRLDDAFDLCVEMLEMGHSINVSTFIGLVDEFCNEKGVEDAREVIRVLKEKGFVLDERGVRVYLNKNGPKSSMVWEAIFISHKKSTHIDF